MFTKTKQRVLVCGYRKDEEATASQSKCVFTEGSKELEGSKESLSVRISGAVEDLEDGACDGCDLVSVEMATKSSKWETCTIKPASSAAEE